MYKYVQGFHAAADVALDLDLRVLPKGPMLPRFVIAWLPRGTPAIDSSFCRRRRRRVRGTAAGDGARHSAQPLDA